jgi:hypothetical protein
MGSKFVEKHKRKSVLAALLFIFQGRAKFVSIMLIVSILSVPFVISGETLGRIIELRPVAAFLRSVGMGSVVSAINPKYSNDLLKAAIDKSVEDSENNSFWNKFLKSINATMPPAGSPSSMTMLRGGGDIFGLPELKEPKGAKPGPDQVKGAVNDEERERGETGNDVNLEGLLAGGGAAGEGGLYGDVMGQNLADRYGDGASAGNAPYMNRTMFGGNSAGGRSAGMYNNVVGQASSKVPLPGSPQKINTKKMGRVSGFTWKNVGFKKGKTNMDVKIGDKKPMFQLAQTFSMTASAYKSKESAPEYQNAFVGATYDGLDVDLDVIQTDATAPAVPDAGFTSGIMSGISGMQESAKKCSDSQGKEGAQMSYDGKMMDDTSKTLGKPPKCCSNVDPWNSKIDKIIGYCADYNVNEAILAANCQNKSSPMDCGSYSSMKIKKCSKWKCWLSIILAILMIIVGLMTGQLWLVAIGVGMAVSQLVPGIFGMLLGALMGGLVASMFNTVVTGFQKVLGFIVEQATGDQEGVQGDKTDMEK